MSSNNEETIRNQIEQLIPSKLSNFPKLVSGEPYRFDRWSRDREGRLCLYYVITGGQREYKKRIPMQELIEAASFFRKEGKFRRSDFRRFCPIAKRNGSCGYAVILKILESLYDRKIVT